ncbi:NAD(P)-binding protein [Corynespora cassiicola Philippines]|uniref:NAD(P)-binding protein n=1 Tax=Corynespora cassiicola Philippines TaxID=1448308 RepID=A0A2T2P0X7_CORCC|nr:NAD(P)-binding protein [Corynespora cassiicola Philippines]
MSTFVNKVAIVTGCSSGIGLATALLLLERQARVFGVDLSPCNNALTESQSENFAFHQANLTEANACVDVVKACTAKFGPKIDVLVNCAGIMDAWSSADTLKDEEWEKLLAVNLTVPVRLMTAVLPSMKEHKGGAIVNVASKAAVTGASAGIAYTASKHGLIGATKNVAWRFHDENIRCNAVLPGGVHTNIHNSVQMQNFDQEAYATFSPVFMLHVSKDEQGRPKPVVTVDDVARGIAFLASDESRMINGASLPIDNAWSVI